MEHPTVATQAEVAAVIPGRYRGRAWPGQPDLDIKADGSWAARPANQLGHDDMVHFLAAVRQAQQMHPVVRG
jgi:hypothetical protein